MPIDRMNQVKPRRLATLIATVGLFTGALTGCGSETTDPANADPTRSPEFFYSVIADTLWQADALHASNLPQALPNRTIWSVSSKGDRAEYQFSDAIVAGRVVKVEPLRAQIWSDTDDETYEAVDFDDPKADSRAVSVTMKVTDTIGVKATDGMFTFTVGVIAAGHDDPYAYMESLRGLGDAVFVLERSENGFKPGEYKPAAGAVLIGQISKDGSLSFPVLGEHEKEFVQGIDTLDALLAEAKKPTVMIHLDTEYVSPTATEHDH